MHLELVQSNPAPSRARRAELTSSGQACDRALRQLIVGLAIAMIIGAAASSSPADTLQRGPVVILPDREITIPVPAPPSNADPMNPKSPGDVVTQRYNNLRTGATVYGGLDQRAVSSPKFGFIGILGAKDLEDTHDPNHIDGVVVAQPLFMASVDFPQGQRSAVFIATSTNWVYAFDADTLEKLWEHHLGDPFTIQNPFPPNQPPNKLACQMSGTQNHDGESIELGIESTPVIDVARSHIIVSYRMMDGIPGIPGADGLPSSGAQRVAALELGTGNVAKLPDGTLLDRRITDDPMWNQLHRNRASLLLDGDKVYVALAGRCETGDPPIFKNSYQGWIFAFNADTLAPAGRYRSTQQPDGVPPLNPADDPVAGGGIWQASTGLAADGRGNLYFATGNQTKCTATSCSPPDSAGKNLSNSIVRLRVDPGGTPGSISMTPADWFTPYRKKWLDALDLDFAAAGVVLIPNTRYLVVGGKDGMMYVLDRNHLGKFDGSMPFDASKLIIPPPENFHTSGDPVGLDNLRRDQVVQKFQAAQNQYCAAGPNPIYCLSKGTSYPPSPPPPGPGVTTSDWIMWPHIHGTPVFGAFPDGRAFLYLWAEKDFLKSFRWWGKRFDTTPAAITVNMLPKPGVATNKSGDAVLAPPYLSDQVLANGMPGGMLSLTIDPAQPAAGVLFASVQRCKAFQPTESETAFNECSVQRCTNSTNCQEPRFGMLRAFDPITLRELWNNQNDPFASDTDRTYWFAKFVPPTIAHGRVFLATASRRVLVYGMH
jgi:outer membrane protein assembly factor BamB